MFFFFFFCYLLFFYFFKYASKRPTTILSESLHILYIMNALNYSEQQQDQTAQMHTLI